MALFGGIKTDNLVKQKSSIDSTGLERTLSAILEGCGDVEHRVKALETQMEEEEPIDRILQRLDSLETWK